MDKDEFISFIDRVRNRADLGNLDEARTKLEIILRVLSMLNWNVFDPTDVVAEYPTKSGGKVDYALCCKGKPFVFVEAKKPTENLDAHAEQLLRYAFSKGVGLAILTNGISWWFYLPMMEGDWDERKFYSIDLEKTQDPTGIYDRFVDFLEKENVLSNRTVEIAERTLKSRQRSKVIEDTLPKAWNQIISEPNDILVDLLSEETESKCGYAPDKTAVMRFLKKVEASLGSEPPTSPQTKPRPVIRRRQKVQPEASFQGKRPTTFALVGKMYSANRWKDILIKTCEVMNQKHPATFEEKILELPARKRKRFSRNPKELKDNQPQLIPGTDVYAITKYDADVMVRKSQEVIQAFGYDESELIVQAE